MQPESRIKWYLKQFVLDDTPGASPVPAVVVDYGFMNCHSDEDRATLREAYRLVLTQPGAEPLKLHEACIKGELFRYVERFVAIRPMRKVYARLLKNPYPLHDV